MQRVMLEFDQIHENVIRLTDPQIHYLRRVLRLREGDRFIALDGQGHGWVAGLGQEMAVADIVQPWRCNTELSMPIHLIIAMPKIGMDDIVRQATELGVSSIAPVVSDRTLLNPSPKKVDRWRRIAQEAIEQCERQWVPTIAEPRRFRDALVEITPSNSPTPYASPPQMVRSVSEASTANAPGSDRRPMTLQWICVARSDMIDPIPQHLLGGDVGGVFLTVSQGQLSLPTIRNQLGRLPLPWDQKGVGRHQRWRKRSR